jgi:hypothetical protein
MSKKIAKEKLPDSDEGLDARAHAVDDYAAPHVEGVGGASGDWPDVSMARWQNFKAALANWDVAYAASKKPHLPGVTKDKNAAGKALREALKDLFEHGFLLDPRTEGDVVNMGFELVDSNPTSVPIPDTVGVILQLILMAGHAIRIHFKDELSPKSEAIPAGMGGLLLFYAWGDAAITDLSLLSERVLMTRSPFVLALPPEAEGKVLSLAVRWQNKKGNLGRWSRISTVRVG